MIRMRPGAKYRTTATKLWRTCTALSCAASSLLLVWFFITARYFTALFGGSIALTTVDQLGYDHLVQDRHIRGDAKHLLAQFELLYGLTGQIKHCSRRHFGYLITCFLIMSKPPLAPGTEPLITSRLRSGSA